MPLYDLVILLKAGLDKREVTNVVQRAGALVYRQQGVVTDVTSFGSVPLAYDIKKRDGWHQRALMVQVTAMAAPQWSRELEMLNKDERLLRWMLVKHRDIGPWMAARKTKDERSF